MACRPGLAAGERAELRVLFVPLRCENMDRLLGFIDPRDGPAPSRTHRPPLTRHLPEDGPVAQQDPGHTPSTWALPGPPEPPVASRAEGRETAAARVAGSRCGGRGRGRAQPAARGTCVTPREKQRRPAPPHAQALRPTETQPDRARPCRPLPRLLSRHEGASGQSFLPPREVGLHRLQRGTLGWKGPGLWAPDAQLSRTPAPGGPSPPYHSAAHRFRNTQTVTRPTGVSWTTTVGKEDRQGVPGIGAVGQG